MCVDVFETNFVYQNIWNTKFVMKKVDFIKNQVREGTFLEGLFILGRILHTQINNFYFFRITQVHVEKRITYTEASILCLWKI